MSNPQADSRPALVADKARLAGADGLRALACLWVYFAHLNQLRPVFIHSAPWLDRFLRAGGAGVAAFFVLSGFLLSMPFWSAWRAGRPMPSLKVYAIRRLGRILPGLYAVTLITAIAFGAYKTKWDLLTLATTLTFTNGLLAGTFFPSFDGPLWSISTEMQFYVMLPLWAWGLFKVRGAWVARAYLVTTIVVIMAGQWLFLRQAPAIEKWIDHPGIFRAAPSAWSTWRNAPAMFSHFLIGVLAADVLLDLRARPVTGDASSASRGWNRADGVVALALGLVIALACAPVSWLPAIDYMQTGFPTFHLLIAAILVAAPFSTRMGRWLDAGWLRWTATLSFGIYLWHWPMQHMFDKRWPIRLDNAYADAAVFGLGVLAVTYAIAAASWYLLEKPIVDLSHRWSKPAMAA